MPAVVFCKGSIRPQIHRHLRPAGRTSGDQLCRHCHFQLSAFRNRQAPVFCYDKALCPNHLSDGILVVISLRQTGIPALKQSVISLCIKKPLFVKTRFLETMIDIGGKDKIVFILYQCKKSVIGIIGYLYITVQPDMPAPPCPALTCCFKRVESP